MQDESGAMQQVAVEVGVDNDNYVAITSGLKEGDTVYKVAETETSAASGLMSIFSSLGGGMSTPGGMSMPSGGGSNRQNFGVGSGGFGGGMGGGREW